MYCMYWFKIHAHKYTYCVLLNFYVCMCIYLYVCVCIFCGKTRRRVDTDTYIHIHAHTYKFSKKYIHIKQKYIPYSYQIQTFQTRTLLFYLKLHVIFCMHLYVFCMYYKSVHISMYLYVLYVSVSI